MTSSKRVLVLLVGSLSLLAAQTALAQPEPPTAGAFETARSLYKQGKELRAQGDVKGALEKFEAAHALGRTPVTGIELARTYASLGRLVEAREVCLSIGRMPVASDETSKSAEARAEAIRVAEDLRPRIPSLAVRVNGLLPGEAAHLVLDGTAVPDAALQEALKIDPGKHEVLVRAGEGANAREVRETAELGEGEVREVIATLPLPTAPPPPPAPPSALAPAPSRESPPASPPSSASPTLVRLGAGAALVGGVVGLVAGTQALSQKSLLDRECQGELCEGSGARTLESARTWATVCNVSLVVAGAGAVAAIVGLLTGNRDRGPRGEPAARVVPWVGAGMVGVHADF